MVKFKDFSRPFCVFQVVFKANLIYKDFSRQSCKFKYFSSLCEHWTPTVAINCMILTKIFRGISLGVTTFEPFGNRLLTILWRRLVVAVLLSHFILTIYTLNEKQKFTHQFIKTISWGVEISYPFCRTRSHFIRDKLKISNVLVLGESLKKVNTIMYLIIYNYYELTYCLENNMNPDQLTSSEAS